MKSTCFLYRTVRPSQIWPISNHVVTFPRLSGSRLPASAAPLLTAQAVGLANTGPDIAPKFMMCNYSPAGNSQGEFGENIAKPMGDLAVFVALVAKIEKNTPEKKRQFRYERRDSWTHDDRFGSKSM